MNQNINVQCFSGFHGTDAVSARSISEYNFTLSKGDSHWLGDGVYFFIEGIGNPKEHAVNWAKSEAFKKKYNVYAVLNAQITINDEVILDMRKDEGLELFNQYRRFILEALRKIQRVPKSYSDGKVFNHFKHKIGVEAIIMNFYVRFLRDRIEKVPSNIPNCTFLCVSNPSDSIAYDTIQTIESGPVQ